MKVKLTTLFFISVYVALCINSALKGGDFDIYLDAAINMTHQYNIYDPPIYFKEGLSYFYSPLFALILIPFSGNFLITEFIWLLLSGFFYV